MTLPQDKGRFLDLSEASVSVKALCTGFPESTRLLPRSQRGSQGGREGFPRAIPDFVSSASRKAVHSRMGQLQRDWVIVKRWGECHEKKGRIEIALGRPPVGGPALASEAPVVPWDPLAPTFAPFTPHSLNLSPLISIFPGLSHRVLPEGSAGLALHPDHRRRKHHEAGYPSQV